MKKKIDIEDTKTKIIILIISIVLIIIIVSGTSYYFISKWEAPISNESKEETEVIDEIKIPEGNLYHIVYLENNITYDILIDENYNISMASKSDTNESLLNEKHTQINFFDNKQKEWLINYLNNLEYPYNLVGEIELENYNYAISNYQIEKGLANIEYENYLLDIIIYSLVTENATYYDYFMRDNNVTNYISDTNYQELDVNEEKRGRGRPKKAVEEIANPQLNKLEPMPTVSSLKRSLTANDSVSMLNNTQDIVFASKNVTTTNININMTKTINNEQTEHEVNINKVEENTTLSAPREIDEDDQEVEVDSEEDKDYDDINIKDEAPKGGIEDLLKALLDD